MTEGEARGLKRTIGNRQLSMIAIGGAIGTGLFFASGAAIAQAGPGGALLAYGTMGLAVYCMMQSLGEMATQLPIPGSFEAYAERFVDPSVAFAVGWNYWFSWAITLAAELVAGALIVKFWFPNSDSAYWAMGFFAVLLALNLLSVRAYAEAEYWFAGIKVVTVIIFVAVGFLMIAGMFGNHSSGFHNWTLSDPKAGTHAPFRRGIHRHARGVLGGGIFLPGHREAWVLPLPKPRIPARMYRKRFEPCSGAFCCFTSAPFSLPAR